MSSSALVLSLSNQIVCLLPSHCAQFTQVSTGVALHGHAETRGCFHSQIQQLAGRREPVWCGEMGCEAGAVFIATQLLCCLICYLTWLANTWKATEGQDQVIPAPLCTGCYSRTSYSLLLHLLPGLCTLYKQRCPFPLYSPDCLTTVKSPLIMFLAIFHLPDPSVLPRWQAETVPLYVSGQVYKAWYSDIVHRCKWTDLEQD